MEYDVRRVDTKNLEFSVPLLSTCFNRREDRLRQSVSWKYLSGPSGFSAIGYMACLGDRAISLYMNMPYTVAEGAVLHKSMLCLDMATDPIWRGKGLISVLSRKTYEDVRKEGYEFTIGFSNAEGVQVDRHSRGYGYVVVEQFTHYIHKETLKRPVFAFERIDPSDPLLWYSPCQNPYFHVHKSREFIRWRYMEKPYAPYVLYKMTGTGSDGILVVRKNALFLDVVDIAGIPLQKLDGVISSLPSLCMKNRTIVVKCSVLDNTLWQNLFRKSGYMRYPVEKVKYYLTVKKHTSETDDRVFDKHAWFLMTGDIL